MKPTSCVCAFLFLCGNVFGEGWYPQVDGSFGYGLFQRLGLGDMQNDEALNLDCPYLAGTAYYLGWAMFEPKEGDYQWDYMERLIKKWQDKGKRVMFRIDVINKRPRPDLAFGTPEWVFQSGAKRLVAHSSGEKTASHWPVYWDPKFFDKFSNFIKAMAKRFDGHPGIEFMMIGFGEFATTKVCGPSSKVMDQYEKAGYNKNLWVDTVKKTMDLYKESFVKTPVCATLAPFHKIGDGSEPEVYKLGQHAGGKGIYLFNHSLNSTSKWFSKDNIYPKLFNEVRSQTKIAIGPDDPVISKLGRGGAGEGRVRDQGEIDEVLDLAFGGIRGMPETSVDYLVFYPEDIAAITPGNVDYNAQAESTVQEAIRRLKDSQEPNQNK